MDAARWTAPCDVATAAIADSERENANASELMFEPPTEDAKINATATMAEDATSATAITKGPVAFFTVR